MIRIKRTPEPPLLTEYKTRLTKNYLAAVTAYKNNKSAHTKLHCK